MRHALLVGGTGMLAGVALELAKRGFRVTVIARTPASLQRLTEQAVNCKGMIHPVTQNYCDTDGLIHSLEKSTKYCGPIELAVIWIHSTAPEAPLRLAQLLETQKKECDLYHVLGSSAVNPSSDAQDTQLNAKIFEFVDYKRIILGFIVENGRSRWLTNNEISNGVVDAIDASHNMFIVGQVEPWSLKP